MLGFDLADESVTPNKYFHYDEENVEKLELVRDAKSIGFTLNEIGQLMEAVRFR